MATEVAKVFGIPIRVHITLWILLPFIALSISDSFFLGLLVAGGVFASVALHELGHSLVALAKGCRVQEILLLPIGGMAQLDRLPDKPKDEILIALAGPAVSLLLGGVFAALSYLGINLLFWPLFSAIMSTLAGLNLILALFNLLPSFPMDGGRVFRAIMTPRLGRVAATRIATKTGRVIAVIFGIIGLMTFPYGLNLLVVAIFIYFAAGAEYRAVLMQEAADNEPVNPFFHAWPRRDLRDHPIDYQDSDIVVGPPPYEKKR